VSTVAYLLGTPRTAANQGGDCRARDLAQARNVHGPHRFAATTDCKISNGLLRLTVGATGAAPSLTVEARRGVVTVSDALSDTLTDTLPGSMSTASWQAMGTITIDSPAVSALLTGVRIVRVSAEAVTIRLVAPLMGDAFVTLRRGFRAVSITHGSARRAISVTRRVRWTDTVAPVGTAGAGRVEETAPAYDGFPRFVAALDPATANAGAFSMTTTANTHARFGAGVGTTNTRDTVADIHAQLADNSRPTLELVSA